MTPVRIGDDTIVTIHLKNKSNGHRGHGGKGPAGKRNAGKTSEPICLLPGPVAIAESVKAAFVEPLVYHRGDEFQPLFQRVRTRLSEIVGGKPAALLVGSGTLANDAVAATLAAEKSTGLVLIAGEFGERILKQARGWGLDPHTLRWDWGQTWNLAEVEATLKARPEIRWVWGVHHETSTGVLNDLPGLTRLAKSFDRRVCVDCVSSIGTVPVDLSDVYLASGTSGKALGSYAGLAFVYGYPQEIAAVRGNGPMPQYVDVLAALEANGPRFTVPSPLVRALDAAMEPLATDESRKARFAHIANLGKHLRSCIRKIGCTPLADDAIANPSIVTFAPPTGLNAAEFVTRCRDYGYLIAGQSGYLAERNLVQIAIMGDVNQDHVDGLFDRL